MSNGWRPFAVYEPYRDTRDTVARAMIPAYQHTFHDGRTFARVRGLVEDVCRGLAGKDYASEHIAWHNWVTDHVRYMRDPGPVELVKAPDQLLDEIERNGLAQDDCEAIAGLEAVGHAALGAPARFVTVSFLRGPKPPILAPSVPWPLHTHAFAQAQDPRTGRWMTTDPVAGGRTPWMLRSYTDARVFPLPA